MSKFMQLGLDAKTQILPASNTKTIVTVVGENVGTVIQGQKLQDILYDCKEGDVLECIDSLGGSFVAGDSYEVSVNVYDENIKFIRNKNNYIVNKSNSLFIKKTSSQPEDDYDSWAIDKTYNAPKKEYEPDANVDGYKAFDEIKNIL